MPVPAVSPHNWKRTTVICHFVMGTPINIVSELSFQDRLEAILNADKSFRDRASENEEKNSSRDTQYKTHSDFQATPSNPYKKRITVSREKPHRPSVDDGFIAQLHGAVKDERPSVPVEKLDFDDNLGILLDAAERYYSSVQCEITVRQTA
jgi:hypothetical protein